MLQLVEKRSGWSFGAVGIHGPKNSDPATGRQTNLALGLEQVSYSKPVELGRTAARFIGR